MVKKVMVVLIFLFVALMSMRAANVVVNQRVLVLPFTGDSQRLSLGNELQFMIQAAAAEKESLTVVGYSLFLDFARTTFNNPETLLSSLTEEQLSEICMALSVQLVVFGNYQVTDGTVAITVNEYGFLKGETSSREFNNIALDSDIFAKIDEATGILVDQMVTRYPRVLRSVLLDKYKNEKTVNVIRYIRLGKTMTPELYTRSRNRLLGGLTGTSIGTVLAGGAGITSFFLVVDPNDLLEDGLTNTTIILGLSTVVSFIAVVPLVILVIYFGITMAVVYARWRRSDVMTRDQYRQWLRERRSEKGNVSLFIQSSRFTYTGVTSGQPSISGGVSFVL
jgi:hypothetical protein